MPRAFDGLFGPGSAGSPRLLGVVHLAPLPGAPGFDVKGGMSAVIGAALEDALALMEGGMAGLIVENFGDAPFWKDRVPPETIAAMSRVVAEIRLEVHGPLGVNVLRNDAAAALAIAVACEADFIRVNVLSGAMLTDQGLIEGRAAELARMRQALASPALILADVLVKHASPLGEGGLLQAAEDTWERAGADALLLTGAGTGKPASLEEAASLRRALPGAPLVVASGVTLESVGAWLRATDAAIVGTWVKKNGKVSERVDSSRVRQLVDRAVADAIA